MKLLVPALLIGALLVPGTAQTKDFWEQEESQTTYEVALAQGDDFAFRATRLKRRTQSISARRAWQAAAKQAVAAYASATQAKAEALAPHFRAAAVYSEFLIDSNTAPAHLLRQAIANWDALEKKSPLQANLASLLFSRAIALTKLGGTDNLKRAVDDYDRQLQFQDHASEQHNQRRHLATLLSNRAEVLMALAQLDDAIMGYEEALAYRKDTVYGYGLAVALDRDGQARRAREVARQYARSDRGRALHDGNTFFVPPGEIHYYEAIRHEGLGQREAAAEAYQAFLRLLPGSQWAKRAKENLKALQSKPKKKR